MAVFLIPQASAADITFDGIVYDTDGITPVKAIVIVYYPTHLSGIATSTSLDGYWPYGYYLIPTDWCAGTATIYAYTFTDDTGHPYMDRKSQEVVINLNDVALGSYVTQNFTLHTLPHEPDPVVTFQGHITQSGQGSNQRASIRVLRQPSSGHHGRRHRLLQFAAPLRRPDGKYVGHFWQLRVPALVARGRCPATQ